MSKPEVGTPSGISSGDVLILPEQHPACRRREARLGSGMERENLAGAAKGKGASGAHREAESTDAPERGGPPRSSAEGADLSHWRLNGNVAGIRVLYFPDGTIKLVRAGENLVHRQSRLPIH